MVADSSLTRAFFPLPGQTTDKRPRRTETPCFSHFISRAGTIDGYPSGECCNSQNCTGLFSSSGTQIANEQLQPRPRPQAGVRERSKGASEKDLMTTYTVYLDTSFINRLAGPPNRNAIIRQQWLISRAWWDQYRGQATLITSAFTFRESCVEYKNERVIRLRLRYFSHITIVRPPLAQINRLADALRQPKGPVPQDEIRDAQHIAVAAITGCPYLLTWNYAHMANSFSRKIVDNIVERHGYQPPTLGTPEQFLAAPPF